MLRSSRGHDRSPRAAGSPPPSSPPGTLPSRDRRAPALSAPEPATIVHHPGSQGSPRRPCPHPEAAALSGRGLRCPAVASPRPAAAVGQRGVLGPRGGARGLSAGCPAARQELPRGTPGAERQRGQLWGPAARDRCPARCHRRGKTARPGLLPRSYRHGAEGTALSRRTTHPLGAAPRQRAEKRPPRWCPPRRGRRRAAGSRFC